MNRYEALGMTRELLNKYDLQHVQVELNPRLTRAFGRYIWHSYLPAKKIELSIKLVEINTEERVRLTVLHEIAHALTEGHGHDMVWRNKLIEIGGDGKRCYDRSDTNTVERTRSSKLYQLECQDCGYIGARRYRRRMNGYAHRGCGGKLINKEVE